MRPGVGEWIVKRVEKEYTLLYKAEKNILTTLRHDFLPIVFDVFEDAAALYIAMEYLPGESLRQLILSERVTTEADARKYFVQLCELFEYLHSKGVVHKDCKPSNIMLSDNNNVYLIDFGISKSAEFNPAGRTVKYASPEQIKNPSISDPRTDIYSLGATMYSLLTKEIPSRSGFDTAYAVEKLRKRVDISKRFREIILKCMAKDPNERYQTVGEVRSALLKKDWVWKASIAMFAMLFFTVITFFGVRTWIGEITERLIPRGDEMRVASNYQNAASHYHNYIQRRPISPLGYERYRRLLIHRGQYSQSIEMFNANEAALFQEFMELDTEYMHTWSEAVSRTLQHYYSRRNWSRLLELLENPNVQVVVIEYQDIAMRGQVFRQLGDWSSALLLYLELLEYNWEDYVPRSTHVQNLLAGAFVASQVGADHYNFLTQAYAINNSTAVAHHISDLIHDYYMRRALSYHNNNEFENVVNVIADVLQGYPLFSDSFDLLYLRAVAMSWLLLQGEDVARFEEYTAAAMEAASGRGDIERVEDLLNLLE